jgi:hypothetical protein
MAWGEAECGFALAHWRSQLALRPALVDAWRALGRKPRLVGAELQAALEGAGAYSRDGALCGRLVMVLTELGLAEYDPPSRACRVREGRTAELQRSAAFRSYADRLSAAERYLSGAAHGAGDAGLGPRGAAALADAV